MLSTTFKKCLLGISMVATLNACKKNDMPSGKDVMGPDIDLVGLTADNKLVLFSADMPGDFTSTLSINGIESGEKIISIDFRPATGELYGLSNNSRLFIINYDNGNARPVSSTTFSPAITGTSAAIDFNPTVDRIRLVSNQGQNLRLNPETGMVVFTDGSISGPMGATIGSVAYTNSMAGAASTTLFDIDFVNGMLYKQDPPNNGTLVTVGSLGVKASGPAGFDISPDNNHALAVAANTNNTTNIFTIDLTTGKANKIRTLPVLLLDIAIPTNPVAYAVDGSNNLHIFNPASPSGTIMKPLSGLPMGTMVVGIDFRPVNGQLYALGSNSQLYTVNTSNGAVAAVGLPLATPLDGTDFGFDFNPTVDRIRVVSNTGQNLRLHPVTGAVAVVDINLNPGSPMVSAAAYTNNFAGATTTELLVIDYSNGKFYLQNPPNNGTLVERGMLGTPVSSASGFDIGGRSNKGLALFANASQSQLYTINLSSGSATESKMVMVTSPRGFAIAPGF
jgi:Domain of unknown function (DUF4394)